MGWNPLKDVKKVVKKVYDPLEDVVSGTGHLLEKGVSETGKGLEKVGQEFGKGLESAGQEVERFGEKAGQEISNAWVRGGVRDALIAAGTVAGAIYTGGALAGVAGVTTATGAAMTGATALGSATALTAVGTAAVQGQQSGRQAYKTEKANREYQAIVDKANKEALEERKSSLLRTKKQLMPNLTKSSQGGVGGSTDESTIILG